MLLRPDNFTPPTRTPWGGRRLATYYKAGLLDAARSQEVIGESWEISVEPSFPSVIEATGDTLVRTVARDPVGWLGAEVAARHGGQTPLLIKLLDAADELSVQVHPRSDDPAIGPGESGKPESWIVLAADPGAGLYLGFREGVERDDVADCLADAGALDQLLEFVPCRPGDTFVIDAGTPHAIGRGLTLVEPQFVTPGCRGVTYRFWDWNRRYDDQGRRSDRGRPRDLHVARSLEVTDWSTPGGEAFVAACRSSPVPLEGGGLDRALEVDWRWFQVESWRGTGTMALPPASTLWGLTCVAGSAHIETRTGSVTLARGRSCVVPASAGALQVHGVDAHIIACRSPTSSPGSAPARRQSGRTLPA